MKHLKSFKQFEDLANASVSGAGAVTSAQPSSNPGALTGTAFVSGGGTSGSGDVSFTLGSKKRGKLKRGNARQVSDMRYLGSDKIGNFKVVHNKQ